MKSPCTICYAPTDLACSDCQIDLKKTVHVCTSRTCRDAHEAVCTGKSVQV